MKLVHEGDRLVIKKFGGCGVKVFGSVFFVFGLIVLIAFFSGVMTSQKGEPPPFQLIVGVGGLFTMVGFVILFGRVLSTNSPAGMIILPILIFGALGVVGYQLYHKYVIKPLKTPSTMKATLKELSVVPKGGRKISIKTSELEELEVVRGMRYEINPIHMINYGRLRSMPHRERDKQMPHILARSDSGEIRFGHGLSIEELQWIRDVIEYVAISPGE